MSRHAIDAEPPPAMPERLRTMPAGRRSVPPVCSCWPRSVTAARSCAMRKTWAAFAGSDPCCALLIYRIVGALRWSD
jgi:hypothetical protein